MITGTYSFYPLYIIDRIFFKKQKIIVAHMIKKHSNFMEKEHPTVLYSEIHEYSSL